jgi:hypothetical protein
MPIYEFEREDGTVAEEFFSGIGAPSIGETITLEDGTVGTRIVSTTSSGMVRRDVAFVCHSADRVWRGKGPDPAPRRDKLGKPVLHSRKEAVEFGRATGAVYDEL